MKTNAAAEPGGPRRETWQKIDRALKEGKPKTAGDLLAGVEQAAVAKQAWAEVARAIATRVLVTNADRPADDPQRLVDLTAATAAAPAQARGVLTAIQANWTWGFFQANRWRFAQRTTQAADGDERDMAEMASWDLRQIVAEINERFAAAAGAVAKMHAGFDEFLGKSGRHVVFSLSVLCCDTRAPALGDTTAEPPFLAGPTSVAKYGGFFGFVNVNMVLFGFKRPVRHRAA